MPVRRDERRKQWIYRTVVTGPDGVKRRIWGRPNTNTKSAAEFAERAHIARVLTGADPPKEKREEGLTFGEFVETRWWPVYPSSAANSERERATKRDHLDLHLLPVLRDRDISETAGELVVQLFAGLRDKGLSPKTIKNVRGTLARILKSAEEWGVIAKMPNLPRIKAPQSEHDWYTAEESELLFSAARTPEERALFVFAIHTGARFGEQRVLRWSDIDWVGRKVSLSRNLPHNAKTMKAPKSGRSRRVDMTATLEAALKAIRGLQHLQDGLVFRTQHGGMFSLYAARERLERVARRAGLRVIRWHDLRHSFGSQLSAAGVPLRQIQEWMGHSSINMTMRYAHLAPGGGEAIKALDRRAG